MPLILRIMALTRDFIEHREKRQIYDPEINFTGTMNLNCYKHIEVFVLPLGIWQSIS